MRDCGREYALIWRQCSDIIRAKVKYLLDYEDTKTSLCVVTD